MGPHNRMSIAEEYLGDKNVFLADKENAWSSKIWVRDSIWNYYHHFNSYKTDDVKGSFKFSTDSTHMKSISYVLGAIKEGDIRVDKSFQTSTINNSGLTLKEIMEQNQESLVKISFKDFVPVVFDMNFSNGLVHYHYKSGQTNKEIGFYESVKPNQLIQSKHLLMTNLNGYLTRLNLDTSYYDHNLIIENKHIKNAFPEKSFSAKLDYIEYHDMAGKIKKLFDQYGGIRFSYKNTDFEFFCAGGGRFSRAFWEKFEYLSPPKGIQGARSGQALVKIIGPSPIALVFKDGILIHKLYGILIRKLKRKLLIQCDSISFSSLEQGDHIEIEIPKVIGRFRFFARIHTNNLVHATTIGSYELTVSYPDNIYVYNQRKSFRVPFEQEIAISIHKMPADQSPLLYEELPITESLNVQLVDISFGGVRILLPQTFEEQKDDLLIRFSCAFEQESIELQGRFRHIKFLPNEKIWSHGVQFINLPATIEQKIFQYVLELERELLKPEE